jgi:hypothetical protein
VVTWAPSLDLVGKLMSGKNICVASFMQRPDQQPSSKSFCSIM